MPPLTLFDRNTEAIAESSSARYQTTLLDQDGNAIDPSAVSTMTVTLLDDANAVVNGRSAQNCKNANGGTLSAGGVFTLDIDPEDTAVGASVSADVQVRHMTFEVVFSGGTLHHQVDFYVRNLVGV